MIATTFTKSFNIFHTAVFNNFLKSVKRHIIRIYFISISGKEVNITKENAFLTEKQASYLVEKDNQKFNWKNIINFLHSMKLIEHISAKLLYGLYDDITCWKKIFNGISPQNRSLYKKLEVAIIAFNTYLLIREASPQKYDYTKNMEISNTSHIIQKSLNLICDLYNASESWLRDRDIKQLKDLNTLYNDEDYKAPLANVKGVAQISEAYDRY